MSLQLIGKRESFGTMGAIVTAQLTGTLLAVDEVRVLAGQMVAQVVLLYELLAAVATFVAADRLVRQLMLFQTSLLDETLAAEGTHKGLLVVVGLEVDLFAYAVREYLVAEVTGSGLDGTAFPLQVILEQVEQKEGFVARTAAELLL